MEGQDIVGRALATAVAAQVPVLLWGAPGTGKTSLVKSMAEAAGMPCETVIASIREPSDFAGLPVVASASTHGSSTGTDGHEAAPSPRRVDLAPPRWAERLASAGRGLLFFDEVSTAPPAVQAALLRVVLERTVGDLALPDGVAVVAAANPPEQAADGWDLSAPLANRFCHLDWPVDGRTVADGLGGGWGVPALVTLQEGWERQVAVARAWVAGFIRVRPDLALAVPDDAARAGRSWPSPRTWDMSARLLAAVRVARGGELAASVLVRGCVGPGPGVEFLTWLEESDLPDPEVVLADPDSFVLPERGDRAFAALSSVAAAVVTDCTPDRWARGWAVFGRAGEVAPDIAAAAARALARARPPGAPIPSEVHAFAPLLREAGLLS